MEIDGQASDSSWIDEAASQEAPLNVENIFDVADDSAQDASAKEEKADKETAPETETPEIDPDAPEVEVPENGEDGKAPDGGEDEVPAGDASDEEAIGISEDQFKVAHELYTTGLEQISSEVESRYSSEVQDLSSALEKANEILAAAEKHFSTKDEDGFLPEQTYAQGRQLRAIENAAIKASERLAVINNQKQSELADRALDHQIIVNSVAYPQLQGVIAEAKELLKSGFKPESASMLYAAAKSLRVSRGGKVAARGVAPTKAQIEQAAIQKSIAAKRGAGSGIGSKPGGAGTGAKSAAGSKGDQGLSAEASDMLSYISKRCAV